ncbi:hypothetical protein X975_25441, partial [Stegodyphus mimosarum]
MRRDKEGWYIVKLPWLEEQGILKENKLVAECRYASNAEKHIKEGRYADYDAVSHEWLADNITEEVPSEEEKIPCHYLPHPGVFKKNSTISIRSVF